MTHSLLSFCSCLHAEIVDGNAKMTLGMIWTIILRFAIQDISVEGKARRRAAFSKPSCFQPLPSSLGLPCSGVSA